MVVIHVRMEIIRVKNRVTLCDGSDISLTYNLQDFILDFVLVICCTVTGQSIEGHCKPQTCNVAKQGFSRQTTRDLD